MKKYDPANSKNTKEFLDYLQQQRSGQRIAVLWDRASYHRSTEFKEDLEKSNHNLSPAEWQVTCLLFAPNAPEQNPVEDIWLQTKNFVRKFYHLCQSFKVVKWLFEFFADRQLFKLG